MAARNRVEIRDARRLGRKLRRMPKDIRDDLREVLRARVGERVRFEQLARVPKDDPGLAASIEVRIHGGGLKLDIGPGARTKKAYQLAGWRAHFTEFGTRAGLRGKKGAGKKAEKYFHPGNKAQPFIFPGYEAAEEDIKREVRNAIDAALLRAARSE